MLSVFKWHTVHSGALSTVTSLCNHHHTHRQNSFHLAKLQFCSHETLTPHFLLVSAPGALPSTFCL